MDLEFRKQVLLMGLTAAVGMGYVPAVYAEAPSTALEAVQQAKKTPELLLTAKARLSVHPSWSRVPPTVL